MPLKLVYILFAFLFMQPSPRQKLIIIGDSTVRNGQGKGSNGQWGWGSFLPDHLDTNRIAVLNKAMGGTSTRTYYNNPALWQRVLAEINRGDVVLIQFGHNDGSPIVDTSRARGSIPGNGDSYQEVYNPILKQKQMVYSYGFYLRRFVKDIHAKGGKAIILSPVPRNNWKASTVVRNDYAKWAEEAAKQAHAGFVPFQEILAQGYEQEGQERVAQQFFGTSDATHTLADGAKFNARTLADYLQQHPELGLAPLIKK